MVEPIQMATIVVIHPGSYWLRIGRATDTLPVTIPHVIARRHKRFGQPKYEDKILTRGGIFHPDSKYHKEQALRMVDQAIWSRKTSQGQRRHTTPLQQEIQNIPTILCSSPNRRDSSHCKMELLSRADKQKPNNFRLLGDEQSIVLVGSSAFGNVLVLFKKVSVQCTCWAVDKVVQAYNDMVTPQELDEDSGMKWTDTSSQSEVIVGEQALYLKESNIYNIHWPVRHGRFNIHSGPGGSMTAVLQDMEDIWGYCMQKNLNIPLKDLRHYRAILLVPDIYNRQHVKELMNLLMLRLGFGAAIIHQESVMATFGCGLSSACVVDVGDQKTSVCCVEDGISHRNTRLCMTYGGSDITRTFTWLLERAHFPYHECQPTKTMDALLLIELKETFCHLDQDFDGAQLLDFHVSYPNQPTLQYQLKLGDETLQAPMGVFYPQIFGVIGEKMVYTQQRNQGDPEDIHDELYLLQTQSQQQQSSKVKSGSSGPSESTNQPTEAGTVLPVNQLSNSPSSQSQNDLLHHHTEETPPPVISRRISTSQSLDKPLGLDQAIMHSIDCCSSDETKKKMYSCIVVLGGGISLFQGVTEMLQHRIQSKMPPSFRRAVEKVEVICKAKDLDPRLNCWKGGSVLACLDTTQELWIRQREWKKDGLKVLRERSPFVW